jgi:hypothetical protein
MRKTALIFTWLYYACPLQRAQAKEKATPFHPWHQWASETPVETRPAPVEVYPSPNLDPYQEERQEMVESTVPAWVSEVCEPCNCAAPPVRPEEYTRPGICRSSAAHQLRADYLPTVYWPG